MIGVAYGPADNDSRATYAVLAQVGRDTFTVARVAVTSADRAPSVREVRRMRATGTQIRVMRTGPGGLESIMIHPHRELRNSSSWPRKKPRVELPEIHTPAREALLSPCSCGCSALTG